jgi:myo-inositol 2-dehydrogenase/D-chiro-inositol 1-dehydrogenase
VADLAVAVVGAGVHGARYAEHLLRGDVPGMRLAGVSRRDPSDGPRWAARGVRFETAFEALVDDPSVDAVVVASPPEAHVLHALAVLSRGRPLLLEKPVAPDLAGCRRIREAARVPVLVGHSHRYNPVALAFREALRDLGTVRSLLVSLRHERMGQAWQHRPGGGGALLSVGTHAADLARWMTGGEAALQSCLRASAPGEAEGSAVALARLSTGTTLVVDVSIATPARRGALEASGDAGALEGDLVLHELSRREGRTRVPLPLPPAGPGLVPLLRDFAGAARGEGPGMAATLEDGIAAVAFAEACRLYSPR